MPTPIVHVFRSRGTAALPGYFIADTPWAGTFSQSNFGRFQASTELSGGRLASNAGGINQQATQNQWVAAGTFKWALLHRKSTDRGIYTLYFDASSKATIDGYAAADTPNSYTEVTGIVNATAALIAVKAITETKNASSTDYIWQVHTSAIVRTGA